MATSSLIRRLVLGVTFGAFLAAAPGCSRRVAPHAAYASHATIVFIHGLGGSPGDWTEVANDLGRDHRVVLVALPGHAHAPMPDSLPLERAVGNVLATVRTLPPPVVLVGHSVGGLVASRVALRAPDRVAGVVLVETALRPQMPPVERRALLDALRKSPAAVLRDAYGSFGRDSLQGVELAREAGAVEPGMFRMWLAEVLDADLSSEVAALSVPVLVVLGPHSWEPGEPWAVAAGSLGYRSLARAQPVRVDSCAHYVMLDRPRETIALIRDWVARVESGAAAAGGPSSGSRK